MIKPCDERRGVEQCLTTSIPKRQSFTAITGTAGDGSSGIRWDGTAAGSSALLPLSLRFHL